MSDEGYKPTAKFTSGDELQGDTLPYMYHWTGVDYMRGNEMAYTKLNGKVVENYNDMNDIDKLGYKSDLTNKLLLAMVDELAKVRELLDIVTKGTVTWNTP